LIVEELVLIDLRVSTVGEVVAVSFYKTVAFFNNSVGWQLLSDLLTIKSNTVFFSPPAFAKRYSGQARFREALRRASSLSRSATAGKLAFAKRYGKACLREALT
jgi:hypothetical protein